VSKLNIYSLIGKFSILFVGVALFLLTIALILGYIAVKKGLIFLPKLTLWVLTIFYIPAKKISGVFTDDIIIDKICIEIMNKTNEKYFRRVEYKERVIFVPQCLRSLECPAKIDHYGLKCVECGRCCIAKIKNKAEKLGYSLYIVPGSRFTERTIRRDKPKAALGVACPIELNEGMGSLSDKNIYVRGVLLLRDGCVNTDVDLEEVFEQMEMKE
jgi:hypothetical protein